MIERVSPLATTLTVSFIQSNGDNVLLPSCAVAAGTNKGHAGADHAQLAKLDRENDVAPPPKIAPTVGKAIGQARQEKGLTQKELGQKINEKPQVIQEFESSKAQPNPQVLAKMEKALGVKLRGKDIGAPLSGPKKK